MPRGGAEQRRRRAVHIAKPPNSWIDQEFGGCKFVDERLARRFRVFLEQISGSPGESIPLDELRALDPAQL
jgi:hypothetical protein